MTIRGRVKHNKLLIGISFGTLVIVGIAVALFFLNGETISRVSQLNTSEVADNSNVVDPQLERTTPIETTTESFVASSSADVWEICGRAELPIDQESVASFDFDQYIELSDDCIAALEDRLFTMNPFTWRGYAPAFSFFELENPLTFERIFSDPDGNLQRIILAMNDPECLLENGTKVNWALKERCHAEAFMNYAEFYHVCFRHGSSPTRTWLAPRTAKTFVQKWKEMLEEHWIKQQCNKFDSTIAIHESHPEQFETLVAMGMPEFDESKETLREHYPTDFQKKHFVYNTMIEFAARLGDQSAALTYKGQPYGQLSGLFSSEPWNTIQIAYDDPSRERVEQALDFISLLEPFKVQFNWEWLVEHMCYRSDDDESDNPVSCRDIVYDMHTVDQVEGRQLELVNKFEQVAIELGVYE